MNGIMLSGMRFQFQLTKIEWAQRRIVRGYKRDIEAAKAAGKTWQEIERIRNDEFHEWRFCEDEKLNLRSAHLIQQAQKFLISLPKSDDAEAWEDAQTSWHRLTAPAQAQLLKAIRVERKERGEQARLWLGSLTGLVGALVGLVALFFHR